MLLEAGPHPLQTVQPKKILLAATLEMGAGRLEEGSTANGEGEGKAESLPRKDEEDGKTTETLGEGSEQDNSEKQTLALAILRDRGTQK